MMTADNTTRGIWPSQRNATAPAIKSATALTNTDSGVRASNARLATLGPILMPLVMPPTQAAARLPTPRRTSSRLPSRRGSFGAVTSLAHNSASMEAIMASASAPPRMVGASAARSPPGARAVK